VFEWHWLPVTGSRRDVRWLSGLGKTPTFCVFLVFSVEVMEKCCDADGDGECYAQWRSAASEDAGISIALFGVDRKSMGNTVAERSCKIADYLCISCAQRGDYGKVL
jgi:hypothetical protein